MVKSDKRKLIERLDKVFSLFIRLKYATSSGVCKCISCGKYHHWTKIQNGHYMSRRYMSTRFSEDNCRPQCVACNMFNQGNIQMYRHNLIKEIGENRILLVEHKALNEISKFSDFELKEFIKYYTGLVEQLRKQKGL